MPARISVTAACLIFAVLIPALEINDTHLLNELWPAHARLHEAWQLLSSAALSILCLWLVWKETRPRLASVIMLSLTGSFVIAYVARGMYGGSMLHTDGTQLMIAGTNPAIGVMVVASVALVAGLLTKSKDPLGE